MTGKEGLRAGMLEIKIVLGALNQWDVRLQLKLMRPKLSVSRETWDDHIARMRALFEIGIGEPHSQLGQGPDSWTTDKCAWMELFGRPSLQVWLINLMSQVMA
ncbi:hypothetical protein D4764_15G0007880 [Takifugu flavidus]|uniref:Uncharacterized protein n=1 Tax=Takifugu flavidus TaxID=433684 RepID=A0A5C6P0U3_9TELE|nr:hypothetical protein D4764_15G0007880 [Takifugu flavidus]